MHDDDDRHSLSQSASHFTQTKSLRFDSFSPNSSKTLTTTTHGRRQNQSIRVVLEDVKLGDSISVNGTCLTVTDFDAEEFTVGLSPETLRKTSLEELERGSPVNLERALQPVSRMGGHVVHGHVDGTGVIVSMEVEGDSLWVKGFVAVDGTSLTVVDVSDEESCFDFMLVAYTQQKVVIPTKKIGQEVNLEVDIMGKYVERLLTTVGFSMNKPQVIIPSAESSSVLATLSSPNHLFLH
ncbi:hypothetical protein Bca4012_041972 [Brassica carinata]|uniref:Lumazine-binding domain-containing protein n=1 Tax=Brassica carinata TaxID=52824 RepID=A0A8X7UGC2_BRACI|nr:hypothetical protein Bca52824_060252 [Brassica carinata]